MSADHPGGSATCLWPRERLFREVEEEQSAQSLLTRALHEELQQLKQQREDKEEQRQREEHVAQESRPEPTSPSNDEADLSAAIEALAQEEAEREFPADVDGPLQPQEWLL
eukprot:COSAG04_NODE_1084_length_8381_cov_5.970176_1_plen_110_part_10